HDALPIFIAGPNSEGLVNPLRPLVATFSPVFHDPKEPLLPENSRAKAIAVSCQSGALTFAFLSRGRDRQLRFTYQISAGNQTVLEAHDYVDWVLDAGGADIFMSYLEGIRDTQRFRAVAEKAAHAGKPMILAKVGRSDAGRRAAASHTGALARAGMADDAIFRHHGIIRGEDLDPMVELVAQSERIDTILLISSLANPERAKKLAAELAGITASLDKPILLSTYTTATPASIAAIAGAGIPCYTSMPSCARAIKALVDYGRFREKLARRKPVEATAPALRDEVTRALTAAGPVLTEVASKYLLARYGVPLPPEALATSEDEAVAAASRIGSAVALKAQ